MKTYVEQRKEFDGKVFGTPTKWDFCYITPEEYMEMQKEESRAGSPLKTLKELTAAAKRADKGRLCDCGMDNIWENVGLDMCFSCVTGETDRSEDFELTMDKNKQPHY